MTKLPDVNNVDEAVKLLSDPSRLQKFIDVRLLQLAAQDATVAIRAIELLLARPQDDSGRELSSVDTAHLIRLYESPVPREDVWLELARRSFRFFCHFIDPNFVEKPHHAALIDAIDLAIATMKADPHSITFIYAAMPPGHGKSYLCSVLFPAYFLGQFPQWGVLHNSHTATLSHSFSRRARDLVLSPRYRRVFPATAVAEDKTAITDWATVSGGGLRSSGVGAALSGWRGHAVVNDDLVKEGEQNSIYRLDEIWDWYTGAARLRLDPPGMVLMPMTRWSVHDPVGRVLRSMEEDPDADQWVSLEFPALALPNDPLGREVGEPLWPEKFPLKNLLALRALSASMFESLFQQNPRGTGSKLFNKADFHLWPADIQIQASRRAAWCFDLAMSDDQARDYTVWSRVWYDDHTLFFTQIARFQAQFPEVKRLIKSRMAEYPDDDFVFPAHLLETLAVQELRDEMPHARIQVVELKGDKRVRASVLADRAPQGRVNVVTEGDYLAFINEHDLFTGEADEHDDCVDVSSVATHWFGLHREFALALVSAQEQAAPEGMGEVLRRVAGG